MNCQKCGNQIIMGDTFCRVCGTPINNQTQPFNMNQNQTNNNVKSKLPIILFAAVLIAIIVAVYFIFIKDNGKVIESEGVTLYIPNGYTKADNKYGYDAIYESKKEQVGIGKLSHENYGLTLSEWTENMKSNYSACNNPTEKQINGNTWSKMECNDTYQKYTLLLGNNNDKIHLVVVYAYGENNKNYNKVESKIEKNLKFTK